MENYIIRIFQRHPEDQSSIDGLVEIVRGGAEMPFRNAQELWKILQREQWDFKPGEHTRLDNDLKKQTLVLSRKK